jgi:hypothetical protein
LPATRFPGGPLEALAFWANTTTTARVILQPGNATGDMAHVAPVLATRPESAVLVIDDAATALDSKGGGEALADTYTGSFHVAPSRVGYTRVVSGTASGFVAGISATTGNPSNRKYQGTNRSISLNTLTNATEMLVSDYKSAPKRRQGLALLAGELDASLKTNKTATVLDGALEQFLEKKGVPFDRHVAVPWGRKAKRAEEGGTHYEFKTSSTGLEQLTNALYGRDPAVPVPPDKPMQVLLVGDIETAKLNRAGFKDAINIGLFWKDPAWPAPGRREMQVRLFHVLGRLLGYAGRNYVHVGMRSGGVDLFGFAGQPMIYLVKTGSYDARMVKVANGLNGVEDMDYDRLELERFPKRYADAAFTGATESTVRDDTRKADATAKGFSDQDVKKLTDAIFAKL